MIPSAKEYIENFLMIRTKDGELKHLILNKPQLKYYQAVKEASEQGIPLRFIILKARQMGFSTMTEALIFYFTVFRFNVKSLIVAHDNDSTKNIFFMSKLFYDMLPLNLKPMTKYKNVRELTFENPSQDDRVKAANPGLLSAIKVQTAGKESVGRGDTFNSVHASEYSFWPGDKANILLGILNSVPNNSSSFVVIESTANGYDDFHKLWEDAVNGRSGFIPLFFAWFEDPEYRMDYDGSPLSVEEKDLMARYNLDVNQIQWRRWCIKTNCGNDLNTFRQEYPSCPEEAFILTGNPVFDNEKVLSRLQDVPKGELGSFDYLYDGSSIRAISWQDDSKGYIRIYQKPDKLTPYVISGDTAGEGSDYFAAHVLNNVTGEQVAVLHLAGSDESEFTRQMYCLGKYYNNALIGIEVNFGTYPIKELIRLGYTNQYRREKEDTLKDGLMSKFGWRTTSITRPNLISTLKEVLKTDIDKINDADTLHECLTFVKNDLGRPEAQQGEHDDLVISLGIAYMIRSQQAMNKAEIEPEPDPYDEPYGTDSFLNYGR